MYFTSMDMSELYWDFFNGDPKIEEVVPYENLEEFETLSAAEMYAKSQLNAEEDPEMYVVNIYYTHDDSMPYTCEGWRTSAQYKVTDVTHEYEFGPAITVTETHQTEPEMSGVDYTMQDHLIVKTITA